MFCKSLLKIAADFDSFGWKLFQDNYTHWYLTKFKLEQQGDYID